MKKNLNKLVISNLLVSSLLFKEVEENFLLPGVSCSGVNLASANVESQQVLSYSKEIPK